MTDPFVDPGEPGEPGAGNLRAKDLINLPLLIRPYDTGSDVGKEDGKPYKFVIADVVVLGVGGIEDHGSGVRFSWKRAIPQLEDRMGQWVGATPRAQEDKSVILVGFAEKGRDIARRVMPEVEALFAAPAPAPVTDAPPPAYEAGEEPFS